MPPFSSLYKKGYGDPTSYAPPVGAGAGTGGAGNPSAYRDASGASSGGYGLAQQIMQAHQSRMNSQTYGNFTPASRLIDSSSLDTTGTPAANEANQKHPGIMSRIFDILGRPEHAVASAIKDSSLDPNRAPEQNQPKNKFNQHSALWQMNPFNWSQAFNPDNVGGRQFNPGGLVKGLSQGIQGKDKTGFADLMNDPASPTMNPALTKGTPFSNPIVRTVSGIAMGAMYDPTTYLSFGTSKLAETAGKAGEIAAELQKAEQAAKAYKGASIASKLAGGIDKGADVLGKARDAQTVGTVAKVVKDAGRTAKLTDEAGNAAKLGKGIKEGDILSKLPQDAKKLQLKFAGIPIASSGKAYTAGRIITDPLRYSGVGQTFADAFMAGHTLPHEVRNLMRGRAGEGSSIAYDTVRGKSQEVLDMYKKLGITKAQDHELYTAMQRGQAIETLPKEMQPAYSFFKEELAKLAKDARQSGKDLKFADHAAWRGADVSKGGYDKASVQLSHMYDKSIKTKAYADFMQELTHRFPANSEELKNAIQKSKDIFGMQGSNGAAFSHYVDKVINPWKRWVTAYRPGFQIKHQLGDLLDANFAGTDVRRFEDSAKVLGKDTKHIDEGSKSISVGGSRVSPSEMDNLYRHNGLERSFINSEVAGTEQRGLAHAATQFAGHREKYTRMATFIHHVDAGMKDGLSFEMAGERAAGVVRKYHGDFSNLTSFERSLKRVIPFYGYTKKELPLLIEQLITNPHKITQVGRMGQIASSLAGVQPDPHNPYPGIDQAVPSWLSQRQIIATGQNRALTPSLPTDHLSWLDPMQAVKQAEGMINPIAKGAIELARGKTLEGIPIRHAGSKAKGRFGEDTPGESNLAADLRYASGYLPYGSFANQSKTSTADKIISLLTGMGEHTVKGKPSGKGGKWAG